MNIEVKEALLRFLETAWIPIVEVVAAIIIGPRVKRLIEKLASKSSNKGLMTFLGSAANILIITIGFILAAEALGVKMTSIIALISALGLGISLALKSNMANVAGGLQILLTKPFKIGDFIAVAGHKGYVESIELMFTTLRTNNDKEIIVPNSTIVSDTITNFSAYPALRIRAKFSAPAGSDFPKLSASVRKLLDENPYLIQSQPKEVAVFSVISGYITLEALGYTTTPQYEKCRRRMMEDLVMKLPFYNTSGPGVEDIHILSEPATLNDSAGNTVESSK